MNLSLRGSQINLATRDKATILQQGANNVGGGGGINVVERSKAASRRPQSACISKKSSSAQLRHQSGNTKRPLSADNKYDININSPLNAKTDLSEIKKKYASSTNLVKLINSDKQANSWLPTDSDLQSESSTSEQIYTSISPPQNRHNHHHQLNNANVSHHFSRFNHFKSTNIAKEASSMKEEVESPSSPPKTSPTEEGGKMSNIIMNNSKGILKLDSSGASKDELKSNIRKHQSYQSWVSENIKTKNLDLPGRVSFSTTTTNNVYEVEYSDCDDTDKSLDSPKATIPKPLNNDSLFQPMKQDLHNHVESDDTATDETDETLNDVCCTSRCSSRYSSSTAKARIESKAREEANKIVEEYKREIEELKKIHMKNPYAGQKPPERYFEDSGETTSPSSQTTKSFESLYQKLSTIEDVDEKSSESPFPMKLNNVWSKEQGGGVASVQTSGSSTASSNAPVIKNYLSKTKNGTHHQLKHKRHNDGSTKQKTTKGTGKAGADAKSKPVSRVKSAPTMSSSAKMRKSKSIPSLRSGSSNVVEDRNIDEFEIDKVVSWMSIHDDFSDTASVNNIEAGMIKSDAITWKAPKSMPAISKVEDEGNFSIEEGPDIDDSPYEEIVSVIKEIENDKLNKGGAMKTLKADVEFKLNTLLSNIESPDSAISDGDDEKIDRKKDKVNEILHYLDEVDSKCDKTLESIKHCSDKDALDVEYIFEPDFTEDIPKVSELLMLTNHQLCRKIVNLSLRVNELNNAIQLSKEHVSNVRAEKMKTVRLEKQSTQKRLNEQKKHYEDIVQRHQNFIEQLLKDKANLCEKVNQLTRRIESQNQAWEHRLKTEVERARETVAAGEKIRREKWVRDNTKKIKELTVKGVEMEINKMTVGHQKEVAELKKLHQKELLEAADEAKLKYDEKEKEIRDSYAKDREGAIERERLAILERFEKQMEDERKMFEQQKQRLIKEVEEEKERIYREAQNQKTHYDASREKLKTESMDLLHHVKQEFREKLKQREIKHQNELKKLEEQFEADFTVWKREYETTMKLREVERENYIRQQSRIERDRQIDSIVAKVDAEALKSQQEHEMKMSRLKEKYEREIKELERQESDAKEKYIESKTRLAECEANITNLQATVKQLETQLSHFKKMCDDFIKEKDTIKSDARKEVQDEIKNVQKERDAEIQRIYARVQKAIEKKDATLEALQKENVKLKERCLKLDALVKQQRKDYCIK